MKSAILINKSGDTEEIKINKITPNCISRCLKAKGKGKSEHLNKWVYNDMNINMYGYKDGEAGDENKFELPPPIEEKLFFGDLLFVNCDSNNNLQELNLEKFIEFYNETMGGFEDIEDTEDEDESTEAGDTDIPTLCYIGLSDLRIVAQCELRKTDECSKNDCGMT